MFDLRLLEPERVRPLRASEYMRLVEAGVFDDEQVELLGGVLVTMSPQGEWHAEIIRRLTKRLILALRDRAWVRSQSGLRVAVDSIPEPDVAVMPIGRPGRAVRWASLVIEVADSSLRKDRGPKAACYAAARIPEYWIVDLRHGRVEVYTEPAPRQRRYARCTVLTYGETLRPTQLARIAIPVTELLPPRRTRRRAPR